MISRFAISASLLLLALATLQPSQAGWPVEGDTELLDVLRDAQATNRQALQHGRLVAQVRYHYYHHHEGRVTVVWDGPNTYRKHDLRVYDPRSGTTLSPDTGEWVENVRELWVYNPRSGFARRFAAGDYKIKRELQLRPDELWYRDQMLPKAWSDFFDSDKWPGATDCKWVVRRGPEETVIVTIHMDGREKIQIVASLRHGGNVIACRYFLHGGGSQERRKSDPWEEATWDWEQDKKDRWYLKRLQARTSAYGDVENAALVEVEMIEFDGDYKPPAGRFTVESLNLPAGTRIEEMKDGTKERVYTLGGLQPE